jgi:hypothetical protein
VKDNRASLVVKDSDRLGRVHDNPSIECSRPKRSRDAASHSRQMTAAAATSGYPTLIAGWAKVYTSSRVAAGLTALVRRFFSRRAMGSGCRG